MKKTSSPIVFFGSGPVAAQSLEWLNQHFNIEAVITKPQPAHHKDTFPVLSVINKNKLKAFYPASQDDLSVLFSTTSFKSALGIVVDYGIIISKLVIDSLPKGIINSHFSLLPQWRGADPITFSILSGQTQTGVSLMLINEKLDEGQLLAQKTYPLNPTITSPELTQKLLSVSNTLLTKNIPLYLNGTLKPYPQDISQSISYSRKLSKEDGKLDWRKPAYQLERQIRAFIEWPKSYATLFNTSVIVTKAVVVKANLKPGEVVINNRQIIVGCSDNALNILELKPAGKSAMTATAFLAGYFKT